MGRPKALVAYRGVPMGARVVAALRGGGCAPVWLVGGDSATLGVLGEQHVADLARGQGQGPLGGVLSALAALPSPVVVAACDLPELTPATVAGLIGHGPADIVVARGARRRPLLRVDASAVAALEQVFAGGERSLMGALAAASELGLTVAEVTVDDCELRDINAPGDVEP